MGLASSLFGSTESRFIKRTYDSDCVVIFSKTTCGYCNWVKRTFQELAVPYTVIELNKLPNGPEIQKLLAEMTGENTVGCCLHSMYFAKIICVLMHINSPYYYFSYFIK